MKLNEETSFPAQPTAITAVSKTQDWLQGQREKVLRKCLEHGIKTDDELLALVEVATGYKIPSAPVCPGHTPPFRYIADSFFERPPLDKIVWGPRGGMKSLGAAILSWLDAIFKSRCEIKILGGSLEQSDRVYHHTIDMWGEYGGCMYDMLKRPPMQKLTELKNGSQISVLTASQKSVRGAHPQKTRLDEVDEFEPAIYRAAMFLSMTKAGIPAATEIFSTVHKAYGLMSTIIEDLPSKGFGLYKYCLFDVLERASVEHNPNTCPLANDCVSDQFPNGKCRVSDGFYRIDDAIAVKNRVSLEAWQSEALCEKTKVEGLVYKQFSREIHVVPHFTPPLDWGRLRTIDFGFTNPFVCLYIALSPTGELYVYDEIYEVGKITQEHARFIAERQKNDLPFKLTVADPEDPDGIATLRSYGVMAVAGTGHEVLKGLELIRRQLKVRLNSAGESKPGLIVMGNCWNTIREFETYRYPDLRDPLEGDFPSENPVKKNDHAMDALKNLMVTLSARRKYRMSKVSGI